MLQGTAEHWVARMQDVDERVVTAIQEVWPICQARFPSDAHEDNITRQIVALLQRRRTGRGRFLVRLQQTEVDLDANGDAVTVGRVDIAVIFALEYDATLVYECKRLNVVPSSGGKKSLATEYVVEGMMRFICCRYGSGVSLGGMLGYVMDGNVDKAWAKVHRAISNHEDVLLLIDEPRILPLAGTVRRVASFHQRSRCVSPFQIRHMLLPL